MELIEKLQEEAVNECDKFGSLYQNSESSENLIVDNQKYDEFQIALLENLDELKGVVIGIKEQIENKHRNNESFIQKNLQQKLTDFIYKVNLQIKNLNRKNVSNLTDYFDKKLMIWQ